MMGSNIIHKTALPFVLTLSFLLSTMLLAGCEAETEPGLDSVKGQATFLIGLEGNLSAVVNTRGDEGVPRLKELRYVISDGKGNILNPHYMRLEEDFSRLTIEGLRYGEYTIAFLGIEGDPQNTEIDNPAATGSDWLKSSLADKPADGAFYYGKVSFTVEKSQDPVMRRIVLKPCVGRVDVDIKMPSEYMWRYVESVSITFDDKEAVPSALSVAGEYGGNGGIDSYDISKPLSFFSFPSEKSLSGYVEIKSSRSNGDSFSYRYRFGGCRIEAGKITHISVGYRHPESDEGLIYLREKDLSAFGTDTMFMANEPREVFYNASQRSFYADEPLQVRLTDERSLGIKFYAPATLKNVKVMCRFNKVSHEFVELAHFETIYPFMEGSFPIPVIEREATFATAAGRRLRIPAQKDLTANDVTFMISTDDPFMKKIEAIDSHWFIRFSPYGADSGHAYWRHMTPLLCRHGVALALNMAFMFSSPEFSEALDKYDGILLDNSGNAIELNSLRTRIRNHGGLVLGRVVGVGGLGGGNTYGLADYCYTGVYFDSTAPGSNPHNYARMAMFHEYGHCLGYSHSSNMTYGDKWTVLCANVFVSMGSQGKLPVNSRLEVESLPMR